MIIITKVSLTSSVTMEVYMLPMYSEKDGWVKVQTTTYKKRDRNEPCTK